MHSQDYHDNPFAYGQAILRAHAVRAERDAAHVRRFARFNGCLESSMHRAIHGEALNDTAFQQCKIKSCPPCHDRRTTEVLDEIVEAYGRALDASKGASPHFLIFIGPEYPLTEAPHCVDEAISSWARFASRRVGKYLLAGYVRSVETQIDHGTNTVRALVKAIVLVHAGRRPTKYGGWLHIWNRSATTEGWAMGHEEEPNPFAAHTQVKLRDFAAKVATLAFTPQSLCEREGSAVVCNPDTLQAMDEATSGRRMICFGGDMSI